MTFPGAGAQVYYNDAGEPLGWDYPSYDEPYDPDAYLPGYNELEEARERAWQAAEDEICDYDVCGYPCNVDAHYDQIHERAKALLADWREMALS